MIKLICFDIDDTLMDFHKGEKIAFYETMKLFQIDVSEKAYQIYGKINEKLWKMFEKGEIEKDALRVLRFVEFKEVMQFHFDEHKVNEIYTEKLAQQCYLFEDSLEVVKTCKKYAKLAAATNGVSRIQRARLNKSTLDTYFDYLFISEEMGCAKPAYDYFKQIFTQAHVKPYEVMFVGDSLSADMAGASLSGCVSVWMNPKHLVNDLRISCDYEIECLKEVIDILKEKQ